MSSEDIDLEQLSDALDASGLLEPSMAGEPSDEEPEDDGLPEDETLDDDAIDDNAVDEEVLEEEDEETDSLEENLESDDDIADEDTGESMEDDAVVADSSDELDDDDEVVTFERSDLDVLVRDPKRGDIVPLSRVFSDRVTQDEWLARTEKVRNEERHNAAHTFEPALRLAEERKAIEDEFLGAPVEFLRNAAQRAEELKILPPGFFQEFAGLIQHMEGQGRYSSQQAVTNMQNQMQATRIQQEQTLLNREKAAQWLRHQDQMFAHKYGQSFFNLPEEHQALVRGMFQQDHGQPDLITVYERVFGQSGPLAGQAPAGSSGQPEQRPVVQSQVVNQSAPTATASRKKLINKLSKPRKKGLPTSKGSAPSTKRSKDSIDDLNSALDGHLNMG